MNSNNCFSLNELNTLPFLERCIKEAIRLRAAGVTVRATLSEFSIPKGDGSSSHYNIPAGSLMLFPHYLFNREIYSNPTFYQPDRFLTEGLRPCTFLGFGAGKHYCCGAKFAMQNMKIIVMTLFSKYDMVLASPVETVNRQLIGLASLAKPVYVDYKVL